MFCPFTKGDCNPECVFNNGCGSNENDPMGCNLNNSADMISSFGFVDVNLEDYLESINTQLLDIKSNTGAVQTSSSSIDSRLANLEFTVEEIKQKLK